MSDQHNYQGGDHQSSEGLGYGQPLDLTTKKKNPLAKVVVLLGLWLRWASLSAV